MKTVEYIFNEKSLRLWITKSLIFLSDAGETVRRVRQLMNSASDARDNNPHTKTLLVIYNRNV